MQLKYFCSTFRREIGAIKETGNVHSVSLAAKSCSTMIALLAVLVRSCRIKELMEPVACTLFQIPFLLGGGDLTIRRLFLAMNLLEVARGSICEIFPWCVMFIALGYVSLKRIQVS